MSGSSSFSMLPLSVQSTASMGEAVSAPHTSETDAAARLLTSPGKASSARWAATVDPAAASRLSISAGPGGP